MSRPLTFTELVDWVDGRLDDERAAEVASRVAEDGTPETAAALEWIREFKAAAALMPLVAPPEHVRSSVRAAFRRLRAPWAGSADDLHLDFDSRFAPLAGVRSAGGPSDLFHLDYSSVGIAVSLDISPLAGNELLVSGTVTGAMTGAEVAEPVDGRTPTDWGVVFNSGGEPRRTTAADRAGRFSTRVPDDVDEIWIVSAARRVRAELSLAGAP